MQKVSHPRIVRKPFIHQLHLPEQVTLALNELAEAAKDRLLAFSVAVGMKVPEQMMAAEVTERVGPMGQHNSSRTASRHGQDVRTIPLGGRRVEIRRPRMRTTTNQELALPSYEFFSREDLLTQAALERMLAGLSARHYGAGLEPVGKLDETGTTKSTVSRRFIQGTQRQLDGLLHRDLSQLECSPSSSTASPWTTIAASSRWAWIAGEESTARALGGEHGKRHRGQRAAQQLDRARARLRARSLVHHR